MFKIVQYVLWRLPCNFFPMQHHFIQAQTFLPCKISFVYHIIPPLSKRGYSEKTGAYLISSGCLQGSNNMAELFQCPSVFIPISFP